MTSEFGNFLYWAITGIAALIAMWGAANFFYGWSQGEPIFPIAGLIFAAVIWLVAWACRFMLSGR